MTKSKQQGMFDAQEETQAIRDICAILKEFNGDARERIMTYLNSAIMRQVYFENIHGEEEQK